MSERGREFTQPHYAFGPHACAVHKYCAKRGFLAGEAEMRKKTGRVSCCLRTEREGGKRRRKRLMAETESEIQCGWGTGLG